MVLGGPRRQGAPGDQIIIHLGSQKKTGFRAVFQPRFLGRFSAPNWPHAAYFLKGAETEGCKKRAQNLGRDFVFVFFLRCAINFCLARRKLYGSWRTTRLSAFPRTETRCLYISTNHPSSGLMGQSVAISLALLLEQAVNNCGGYYICVFYIRPSRFPSTAPNILKSSKQVML